MTRYQIMRRINTREAFGCMNKIVALESVGADIHGVCHIYDVEITDAPYRKPLIDRIVFQTGPRDETGKFHGLLESDLLEIIKDRLTCMKESPSNNKYIDDALHHITKALDAFENMENDKNKEENKNE